MNSLPDEVHVRNAVINLEKKFNNQDRRNADRLLLEQIFGELPTTSLLRFRLVNYHFKDLITPICRAQRHLSINFKWNSKTPKSEIIDLFYNTFQNPLDLPWSGITLNTFNIGGSAGLQYLHFHEIQKLTKIFGPQVKKLELNVHYQYSIPAFVNILNGCPNLRMLKLSHNVGSQFIQTHYQNLLKPTNLKILDISLTPSNSKFLEYFLGVTTGLLEVRIDFYDRVIITNEILSQLASIPNVCINLTHYRDYGEDEMDTCQIFSAHGLKIKEFEFRTPMICHGGPCPEDCNPSAKLGNLLSVNFQSLSKLTIHDNYWDSRFCHQGFNIPTLENLKYIKLISFFGPRKRGLIGLISEADRKSEGSFKRMQKFRNDQFPRLKIVEMEGIYFETNPFQSTQFDGVKELIIKDEEEGEQINWHLIFPNLPRFSGNSFNKNKLSYIMSNLKNLRHLKLGVQTTDSILRVNVIKLRIPDALVEAPQNGARVHGSEFVQPDLTTVTLDFQGCTDTNESLDFYTTFIVNLPKLQYLGLFFTNMSERVREAFNTNHQTFVQY